MKSENVVLQKSREFALRIIKFYQYMSVENREFVLSKQVLRSGTSIGANVNEAQEAQSSADFISKLSIALKEARETKYWLDLLHGSGYITDVQYQSIITDTEELIALLTAIIKTKKAKKN